MTNNLNNLTILVNSCDKYYDLWDPFFKLFEKYGKELKNCQIVLNTDSKQYSYKNLNIICPNYYETIQPWGKRVKNCLKQINTDYVFFLLDDFFLQDYVNTNMFIKIIEWLNIYKNISCFNLISIESAQQEHKIFKNFCLMEKNSNYRYNAQAAIWRVTDLNNSLLNCESAWDWEIYGNKRNNKLFNSKEIYALKYGIISPYNYNFIQYDKSNKNKILVQSPVMRGKWCIDCIDKCFKDNDIEIDYSKRGIYESPKQTKKSLLINLPKFLKFLKRITFIKKLYYSYLKHFRKNYYNQLLLAKENELKKQTELVDKPIKYFETHGEFDSYDNK